MSSATLDAGLLLILTAGVLYVIAGVLVARRRHVGDPEERRALAFFALFWIAMGAWGLLDGLWGMGVVHLGLDGVALAATVLHLKVLAAVLGFLGLVYYLAYLYSGRSELLVPLAVAYVGVLAVVEWYYNMRGPTGVRPGTWGVGLVYRNPGEPAWYLVVALLFGPPIVAAVLYANLLRVVDAPGARLRVAVISVAFATLFGSYAFSWTLGGWFWWGFAEKVLAVGANLAVLVVVAPPGWLQDRWQLEPFGARARGAERFSRDGA